MQAVEQELYGASFMATKAGLTGLSGAATTFSTGGTVTYAIKGKAYTKAAFSTAATPTTDAVTGAAFVAVPKSNGCVFVFGVDSSGNAKVAQGSIVGYDDTNFLTTPLLPIIPDTMCPFAYVLVKNASTGSSWTFGTSNWNATGITLVVQDVLVLPHRPQTS